MNTVICSAVGNWLRIIFKEIVVVTTNNILIRSITSKSSKRFLSKKTLSKMTTHSVMLFTLFVYEYCSVLSVVCLDIMPTSQNPNSVCQNVNIFTTLHYVFQHKTTILWRIAILAISRWSIRWNLTWMSRCHNL